MMDGGTVKIGGIDLGPAVDEVGNDVLLFVLFQDVFQLCHGGIGSPYCIRPLPFLLTILVSWLTNLSGNYYSGRNGGSTVPLGVHAMAILVEGDEGSQVVLQGEASVCAAKSGKGRRDGGAGDEAAASLAEHDDGAAAANDALVAGEEVERADLVLPLRVHVRSPLHCSPLPVSQGDLQTGGGEGRPRRWMTGACAYRVA